MSQTTNKSWYRNPAWYGRTFNRSILGRTDTKCWTDAATGRTEQPSLAASLVLGVTLLGLLSFILSRFVATVDERTGAGQKAVLVVACIAQALAFLVYYFRYRRCNAVEGWIIYAGVSLVILLVTVSLGWEPTIRREDVLGEDYALKERKEAAAH